MRTLYSLERRKYEFRDELVNNAYLIFQFINLNEQKKELIWTNKYFQGLNDFFKELKKNKRVMLSRYRGVIPAKSVPLKSI
jgi:predicted N-acyltransferase